MKWSGSGRLVLACVVSIALMLGVSACGGGTIGYLYVLAGKSSGTTSGNVIIGYKIDNYTGNLTEIVNSPFPTGSGGTPVNAVSLVGGRYIYTVNTGDATNSISQFSVGGDGVLTFQRGFGTFGGTPVWMDINQNFLYVLDQVSLNRVNGVAPPCPSITNPANTDPCGSVEVFQITSDTGNLTPVLNTSIKTSNNIAIPYFPVGPRPTRLKAVASGALLVVNGDGTITSFGFGGNGQLTTSANSTQVLDLTGNSTITSITTGQSFVYLTDGKNNRIFQYTVANGVLQPVNGSPYANTTPNTTPVWTLTTTDASSNQFVYVLNSGSTTTTSGTGSISAYRVNVNNQLSPLPSATINATGSTPVCLAIDPTNQYIYSSNADGTVTGYQLQRSEGTLRPLRRGSSFTAAGVPTCLTATGIF